MTDARLSPDDRALLTATKTFATSSTLHSLWSLTSTLAAFAATLAAVSLAGPGWSLLLVPLLALRHVRIFVLQHDLGHRSFFPSKVANDVVGRLLSVFTGIAHDAWRVEHDWHHQVTGRMDRR
ncbi:MAG TPA: fatty acid desaturase, partial [Myxococcota bacterium]